LKELKSITFDVTALDRRAEQIAKQTHRDMLKIIIESDKLLKLFNSGQKNVRPA
jgi:hypothetical protein